MAKKKGVAEKVAKKEAKKQKQELKSEKSAKKKAGKDAKEVGEQDIESILAELVKKDAQKTAVTVTTCEHPPTPRANFTMTPLPTGEMVMFGGEYYDGQDTTCYNELYRWNVERNEWRRIESPNTPPPRCSHQSVFYNDRLYVFGGEFATTEQFYHYRDLWRLDVKTNAWEKLELLGKAPSARSGHRMTVWRNYLVLFGGFYEASRETKWYNDLYVMAFQDLKWRRIEFSQMAPQPAPRSGHQMAVYTAGDQIFLYGGWSKLKEPGRKSEGKVHNDMWLLNMKPLTSGGNPIWDRTGKKGCPPTIRSGAAMTVHKNRALLFGGVFDEEGANHAVRSVFYNDLYALDMDRRAWYQLGLKRKRDNAAASAGRRRKRKAGAADGGGDDGTEQEEEDYIDSDDEAIAEGRLNPDEREHDEDAFVYIDSEGRLVYVDAADMEDQAEGMEEGGAEAETAATEAPVATGAEAPPPGPPAAAAPEAMAVDLPPAPSEPSAPATTEPSAPPTGDPPAEGEGPRCPLPRINPAVLVRGNTLYIYGGLMEVGDREYTLDDCWSLELNTRTEWTCVQPGTMEQQTWKDDEESDLGSQFDDEDEEDGEDDDGDDMDEDDTAGGSVSVGMSCLTVEDEEKGETKEAGGETEKAERKERKRRKEGIREELRSLQERLGVDDHNRTPQVTESLREFFVRTSHYWTRQQIDRLRAQAGEGVAIGPFAEKELRRGAFALAEARYAELEPVLQRLNELETLQKDMEAAAVARKAAQDKGKGGRDRERR